MKSKQSLFPDYLIGHWDNVETFVQKENGWVSYNKNLSICLSVTFKSNALILHSSGKDELYSYKYYSNFHDFSISDKEKPFCIFGVIEIIAHDVCLIFDLRYVGDNEIRLYDITNVQYIPEDYNLFHKLKRKKDNADNQP